MYSTSTCTYLSRLLLVQCLFRTTQLAIQPIKKDWKVLPDINPRLQAAIAVHSLYATEQPETQ